MSFRTDLQLRLSDKIGNITPDTDPAIWAVRACGVIVKAIGEESLEMDTELRDVLETLFVMAPDKIIEATAEINALYEGDTK